ncbi:MAG TPA: hypothetical protein VKK79_03555, partial [Candidatus Lokiarchaeia archaeon]|nr:hypothetical protein [Candidatus Lokiarchaeia archaeon]
PEKRDQKFFRSLVVRRTWLLGLLVQIGIGTTCTIVAAAFIGPALLPGLLAVGLIPMAIGASKIVGERLKKTEIFAILLIVIAAILLVVSDVSIPVTDPSYFDYNFWAREWIFTGAFFVIIFLCEVAQRKVKKTQSLSLAVQAGCFLALANYWLNPVEAHIVHLFAGELIPWELLNGILGAVVLALANVFNIAATQKAFKSGNASVVIPVEQVPINIAPIIIYFLVFLFPAREASTLPFLLIVVGLIIVSSYLLARRQSQLEGIKIETTESHPEESETPD